MTGVSSATGISSKSLYCTGRYCLLKFDHKFNRRMPRTVFSPHFCGPEREEADGDDAEDDSAASQVVIPGRRVVQPHIRVVT